MDLSADLEPSALEQQFRSGPRALRAYLDARPSTLSSRLARAFDASADQVAQQPEALIDHLCGRLVRDEVTAPWLDAVAAARKSQPRGLCLTSASLPKADRPMQFQIDTPHVEALLALGGDRVAVATYGPLFVADVVRDGAPATVVKHLQGIRALARAQDGHVVAGDASAVRVLDATNWQEITVANHAQVVCVAAAGQRVISGSKDGTACLWDLDARLVHRLDHDARGVVAVAMSTDATRAVTATDNSALHLWDLSSGSYVARLYGGDNKVVRVPIPGVGDSVSGDTHEGPTGHRRCPHVLWLSPDGRWLISADEELVIWDLDARAEFARTLRFGFAATSLVMINDDTVLLGGQGLVAFRVRRDGRWLASSEIERVFRIGADGAHITSLAILSGSHIAAGHGPGGVSRWELPSPAWLTHAPQPGWIVQIAVDPTASRIATATISTARSVVLWDSTSDVRIREINCDCLALAFAPGGAWLALASEERVELFDAKTGAAIRTVSRPEGADWRSLFCFMAVDDDRVLVGSAGRGLWLLDVSGGGNHRALEGFATRTTSHFVTPDGALAIVAASYPPAEETGGSKGSGEWRSYLQAWDLHSGRRLWSICASKKTAFHMSHLLPGGETFLSSSEKKPECVCVRELRTGRVRTEIDVGAAWVRALHIDADGRMRMVVTRDKASWLCDVDLRAPAEQRVTRRGQFTFADGVFLFDATRLAYVREDRVCLVDCATGEEIARLHLGVDLRRIAADPQRSRVIVGDDLGNVHFVAVDKMANGPHRSRSAALPDDAVREVQRLGGTFTSDPPKLTDVRWPEGLFEVWSQPPQPGADPSADLIYFQFDVTPHEKDPRGLVIGRGRDGRRRSSRGIQTRRLVLDVDADPEKDRYLAAEGPFIYASADDGAGWGARARRLLATIQPMRDVLSDAIIAQVQRLGGRIREATGAGAATIKGRSGKRVLPAPLVTWNRIEWPANKSFNGELEPGERVRSADLVACQPFERGTSLYDNPADGEDTADLVRIGGYAGVGGWFNLVIDLDDADPRDPAVSSVDDEDRNYKGMGNVSSLSEFLAVLK